MPEHGGDTGEGDGESSAHPSQPAEARPATPADAPQGTHADEPSPPEPVQSSAQAQGAFTEESAPGAERATGTIRWQEPGVSTPRPPTVAEARKRDQVRKAREEAERYAEEQERERGQRAAKRRKVLIGSGVAVGLVGAVALGYSLLNDDREVSATCVRDGTNEVVSDNYCASGLSSGGGGGGGGVFIFAGSPYRYYYGGSNGGIGSTARGGTIELPKGTTGKTKSGSSISRGGFGSSSHGSSGS